MATQPDPDLQQCIDRAIVEWLADTGGGMVTGSVTLIDFVDADGDQMWAWSVSESQPISKTMGIVEWLRGLLRYELTRYFEGIDQPDQ